MNRLVWLGLIIFVTGIKSKNFQNVSTSDVKSDTSDLYESASEVNFSSDFEDLKGGNEENTTNYDDLNAYDSPSGYLAEDAPINDSNNQGRGLKMDLINSPSSPTPTSLRKMTGEKEILDYLSSFRQHDNKKNSQLLSSIMRREINNRRGYHELIEPENVPWNYQTYDSPDSYQQDQFYRNDMPIERTPENLYSQNRFYEIDQSKTNSSLQPREAASYSGPQYYQKNYYYNFYVLTTDGKVPLQFDIDELISLNRDENSSGDGSKSKCQKYLEFLKFAFERLDELLQNDYDDNEQYETDLNNFQSMLRQPDPNFTTHLMGPTLYIDNSGKISQTNCQATNFQNVGESVSQKFTPTDVNNKFETTVANEEPEPEPETEMRYQARSNFEPEPTDSDQLNTTPPDEHTTCATDNYDFQMKSRILEQVYISPPQNYPKSTSEAETDGFTEEYTNTITTNPPFDVNTYNAPTWIGRVGFYTTPFEAETKVEVTNTPPADTYKFRETTLPPRDSKDVDCKDKMLPCPDTINVTYPLNGYCNRYVTCESGIAVRRHCMEGLHFNPITKSCDLPHNSICTYVCPETDGIYGIPGDCSGYFICKNSAPEYRMCPPKMHWDVRRRTCVFEDQSSCPMKCSKDEEIKSYNGDCKGYIICLKGIPYYHKCPPNMKFDSMTMSCIPADMSNCENDPRLLVKTLNPSVMCNRIMRQFGTKLQCDQFSIIQNTTAPDID